MKRALKLAAGDLLPTAILEREDKMGFPVPARAVGRGAAAASSSATTLAQGRDRPYLRGDADLDELVSSEAGSAADSGACSSLELWQQAYHDRAAHWRRAPRADDGA